MDTKLTMLIVDDIEANRAIMMAAFSNEYRILYAENGKEAIDIIQKYGEHISVILLDIIMPVMDGIEVLKWIKDSAYSSIPIISITTDERYQLEALENGAADFIPKPADERVIKARIKNVIGRFALEKERLINKALEKAKLEMDHLINSIPGGIAIYRLTDHFETLYCSDGVVALTGYTRDEYAAYIQGDASKIIYEKDRARVWSIATDAVKSGAPIDVAYRICLKNGGLVWVNLNAILIKTEDEGFLIHAIFQKSPKMTQLYANLVNESQSAIYVSDTVNYDLLYINQRGLDLIGKSRESCAVKKCYEVLFHQSAPCKFCKIHSMHHDQFIDRDFTYPTNDNVYHLRGKLTDWNGIEAHVEYIEDVTQSRKTEQENKELTDQLSSVIEHVPGGMCLYLVDQNGIHPLVHNQAFYKIFGYSKESVKSIQQQTDYLNVHPDDLAELQSKLTDAIQTSTPVNHTYNEQIRHQKELEQALISAKQATLAKSDFLARMSHDIRTPMNAIIGMTELAKDEENSPKTAEYLRGIDSSSHFLLGLINDILDLSKIESGKIKLFEEPLTMEAFKRNIKTVILPLMEAKHIEFTMNLNCNLTCILTDKLRFTQIYFNLLSNAVKFTPEGGQIEFSCEHIPDRDGKYGMRCTVRDNGIGMSPAFLEHLFEPFSQENREANSNQSGTGLGLAIVKNLVETMGGSIKVSSTMGKGTKFVVDLYVSTADLNEETEKSANCFDTDLSGVRILLVEDNHLNVVIAQRLLERKGCTVEVAANGKQAIQQFSQNTAFFYDAILMDVRMPIMGGLEATEQIRNMAKADAKSIPIIAMTADAFVEDQEKTKKAGMDAHLSKPIDPKLLYRTLYTLIHGEKAVKKEHVRNER